MSYLPLARKYRPAIFDELAGQDFVATSLKNSIELGRVSQAYLFTGARGVGKTSAARILAKALNCLNPSGSNPCNVCEHCVEIASGTAMDVMEIDGASNRGIDEIRELREAVKFLPVKYPYKVYVIDEVHMLTEAASNALLKTLEEPPGYVVFIFATTDAHKIIPTILSRCQRYDFRKINNEDMRKTLENIYLKENVSCDDDTFNIIMRRSEGCMRDALSLSDQLIAYCGGSITFEKARKLLGIDNMPILDSIFMAVLDEDVKSLDKYIKKVWDQGTNLAYVIECFITHTRNLLLLVNGVESVKSALTADEAEFYNIAVKKTGEAKLFALFQLFQTLYSDLKHSSFLLYTFEFGLYKAANISRIIPLTASSLQNQEEGGGGKQSTRHLSADESSTMKSGKISEKRSKGVAENSIKLPTKPSEKQTLGNAEDKQINNKKTKSDIDNYLSTSSQNENNKDKIHEFATNIDEYTSKRSLLDNNKQEVSIIKAQALTENTLTEENKKVSLTPMDKLWHEILTELKEAAPSIAAVLSHASLIGYSNEEVMILFPKERVFQYNRASKPDSLKLLNDFFISRTGNKDIVLNVSNGLDSIKKKPLIDKKEELESMYEVKLKQKYGEKEGVKRLLELLNEPYDKFKISKLDGE